MNLEQAARSVEVARAMFPAWSECGLHSAALVYEEIGFPADVAAFLDKLRKPLNELRRRTERTESYSSAARRRVQETWEADCDVAAVWDFLDAAERLTNEWQRVPRFKRRTSDDRAVAMRNRSLIFSIVDRPSPGRCVVAEVAITGKPITTRPAWQKRCDEWEDALRPPRSGRRKSKGARGP